MLVSDLNDNSIELFEANAFIKALSSKYDYYSLSGNEVTAYYKTKEDKSNVVDGYKYSFVEVGGQLYEKVGVGILEEIEIKESVTPKQKTTFLEQLQLF